MTADEETRLLLDCIEALMELLRQTKAKEEAEKIYKEFFGD